MRRRLPLVDALWLAALSLYALLGIARVPFHGDEAMQLYASRDYDLAFIEGSSAALITAPPYVVDSDAHLRILNGSINRYLTGFLRHLASSGADQLPPRPGWDWGRSYAENVATDHRPAPNLLLLGRLSSALFLALSIPLMFMLGRQFGGRSLAYIASLIYALHPVILLNGRRGMQEGALLCFGLLSLLIAALIVRRMAVGRNILRGQWIALAVAVGLALASKHNAVILAAGAFAFIAAAAAVTISRREILRLAAILILCGAGAFVLFIALSPALWNDPIARLGDLLAVRAELIAIQTQHGALSAPLAERLAAIVTEPFVAPPQFFEVAFWADAPEITAEIAAYQASLLGGWSGVVGALLTLLWALGMIIAAGKIIRRGPESSLYAGLMTALGVAAAAMLVNPLPWQRYFLPLIPLAVLFAAVGANTGIRAIWEIVTRYFRASPAR